MTKRKLKVQFDRHKLHEVSSFDALCVMHSFCCNCSSRHKQLSLPQQCLHCHWCSILHSLVSLQYCNSLQWAVGCITDSVGSILGNRVMITIFWHWTDFDCYVDLVIILSVWDIVPYDRYHYSIGDWMWGLLLGLLMHVAILLFNFCNYSELCDFLQ